MTVNITVDATRDMSFNLKEIENGIYSRSALSLVVEEAFYERQFHNCDGKKKNQLTELQMTLSGEAGDSRVPWNSISLLLDLLTLKGSFFFLRSNLKSCKTPARLIHFIHKVLSVSKALG